MVKYHANQCYNNMSSIHSYVTDICLFFAQRNFAEFFFVLYWYVLIVPQK